MRSLWRANLLVLLAAAVIVIPATAFADAELSFQVNGGTTSPAFQTFTCPSVGPCAAGFSDFADGVFLTVSIGTNLQPEITLTTNTTSLTSPLTLSLDYSITGLTNPGPGYAQSFSGTINADNTASYTQYYDAGNGLDAQTTAIFTSGPVTAGATPLSFAFNNTGDFAFGSGPYSLTMFYTFSIPQGATLENNQLTGAFLVPEPATLSLVGFGLLGLGIAARKKWLKQ